MEKYAVYGKTLENFSFNFQKGIKNSTAVLGGRTKNFDIEMKKILLIVKLWKKHRSETEMEFLDISLTKTRVFCSLLFTVPSPYK
jgi:hypothetical protein